MNSLLRSKAVKRVTATAAFTIGTVGCGYSKTATDYDRAVNFANYHTFFVMVGTSSGNPLLDQRVADNVRAALTSKGWSDVSEGESYAVVVVHAATKTKHTRETFYDGWGGWRWRWGGLGEATTYVESYKVGTVVVDIFDANTKQAIWRGSASNALSDNSARNAKATEEAITKLFASFPPGQSVQ